MAAMNTLKEAKIRRLLEKLLDKNYQIKTDNYLNRLLTHLQHEKTNFGINYIFIVDWLKQALFDDILTRSPNIASFFLSVTSFLSQDEQIFNQLENAGFYTQLFAQIGEKTAVPTIKLGYVKVLTSFLGHNSGLGRICNTNHWENVLEMSLTLPTLYITRECYKFLFELLQTANVFNSTFTILVLDKILVPFHDPEILKTQICNEIIYEKLKPSLDLLQNLLESILKCPNLTESVIQNIAFAILDRFNMESRMETLMLIAHSQDFLFDLQKIALGLYFLRLCCCPGSDMKYFDKIMNLLKLSMAKEHVLGIFRILHLAHLYCDIRGPNLPAMYHNKLQTPITMLDHIVTYQLMPLYAITEMPGIGYSEKVDEFREIFIEKVLNMLCESTVRFCYNMRDLLVAKPCETMQAAKATLEYIVETKKQLPRNQAIIVFQCILYCIKDIMLAAKKCPEGGIQCILQHVAFMGQLFNKVQIFIEDFSITWRDSIETICVMGIAVDFLEVPLWPTSLVVEILKVINISIVKYMSPNLALLVDNTHNTTMAVMGTLLYAKLHDGAWEVRDSALEVVCTIANISNTNSGIFIEWLQNTVSKWSKTPLNITSTCFVLDLTSLLSINENCFNSLNTNNFYIKLIRQSNIRQKQCPKKLHFCYIKLLASFLTHSSGLDWIMATNYYEDVIKLYQQQNCDSILQQQIQLFLLVMLQKTIGLDCEFCSNVIGKITEPLSSIKNTNYINRNGNNLFVITLKLIGNLLDSLLEHQLLQNSDSRLLFLFYKHFHFNNIRLNLLQPNINRKNFMFDLTKVMFTMQYMEILIKMKTKQIPVNEIKVSLHRLMSTFNLNMCQNHYIQVLRFCEFGHLFWSLIYKKIPYEREKIANFQQSITIVQLMPNFMLFKYCFPLSEFDEIYAEHNRSEFLQKVFKIIGESMIRTVYGWRLFLLCTPNIYEFAIHSLNSFVKSKRYFDKERATLIVQGLVHMLQDFIIAGKNDKNKLENFVQKEKLFVDMFAMLTTLLEEFSITWRDSLETNDIMALTFDYLSLPVWPPNVIKEVLKLVRISISKYMSPNLALLIDRTNDTTIVLMGPVLYAKLFDCDKGVRIETLLVLYTLAAISKIKFPSLQKVLMDSELPSLVIKMALADGEGFVRATAIKCLQEMIQIDEIWTNTLKNENVIEKIRTILCEETEGIVRVEAANFMCTAYTHQQINDKETLEKVYETMIQSSTTDLHWEVKVKSLNFWHQVIKNHLQHQGMIDGHFPNVTFSRENRKIVTLNDIEIRKRLEKVLTSLSSIGCLGVLAAAIADDCDIEVCKTAIEITKQLLQLLKQYKVQGSAPSSPNGVQQTSRSISISSGVSECSNQTAAELNADVIEQIVNEKDVDLLKGVYVGSDYGSMISHLDNISPPQMLRKIVTPRDFMAMFVEQDLDQIVLDKRKWLNGMDDLDSLLDDMLKSYDEEEERVEERDRDEEEMNTMDCY